MQKRHVMAFDLGASNGRAIVGEYDGKDISLHEIHRFSNDPVRLGKYLYWDFPRLFHELKTALIKAKNKGYHVESLGIDTWGVDYGLIDKEGNLLGNPIHYRDARAELGMEKLLERYTKEELKKRTNMDCVSYNTVNQLINDPHIRIDGRKDDLLEHDITMLNMPDLFNFYLTGKEYTEYSMATTTQLFDYNTNDWNYELISELNISKDIFNEVIPSGTIVGEIKNQIVKELGIKKTKVVAVTSHDTASAVSAVKEKEDFLFVATGTWIICGLTSEKVTMNEDVMKFGLTNEGGKYPNVNLLKNHVGLWMLQQSKKAWEMEGIDIGFGEMVEQGEASTIDSLLNIEDSRFYDPGDMPAKVKAYCEETNQELPETIGDVVRVIERSLAKRIAETIQELESAAKKQYDEVHLFGGGVQDRFLCRLIEEYTKKKVVIGVKEATAYGNVLTQLEALGIISKEG